MGPDKDSLTPAKNQDARGTPRTRGGPRRTRRPRRRVCLLKDCGRVFRPQQPMARYCSGACQAEARRWRQWKARRRYRQSPNGKQKRQAQSRRYRERRKQRQARETAAALLGVGECSEHLDFWQELANLYPGPWEWLLPEAQASKGTPLPLRGAPQNEGQSSNPLPYLTAIRLKEVVTLKAESEG